MSELVKVDATMFEAVYPLLTGLNAAGGRVTRDDWRRIFDYRWEKDEDHVGYALVDGGTVVGFVGLVFSARQIAGRRERFCNITSWIVDDAHRSEGIALVLDLRNLESCTITDLTPRAEVHDILRTLGFQTLEDTIRVFPPLASARSWLGGRRFRVITAPDAIAARLSGVERTVFDDHQLPYCRHLLVEDGDRTCYVIFKTTYRRGMRLSHILSLSDRTLFGAAFPQVQRALQRVNGTWLTMIDARLLVGLRLGLSVPKRFRYPRLYRSPTLDAAQIDNLYSELVLLPIG